VKTTLSIFPISCQSSLVLDSEGDKGEQEGVIEDQSPKVADSQGSKNNVDKKGVHPNGQKNRAETYFIMREA